VHEFVVDDFHGRCILCFEGITYPNESVFESTEAIRIVAQ
jgi:hypothetical protein